MEVVSGYLESIYASKLRDCSRKGYVTSSGSSNSCSPSTNHSFLDTKLKEDVRSINADRGQAFWDRHSGET